MQRPLSPLQRDEGIPSTHGLAGLDLDLLHLPRRAGSLEMPDLYHPTKLQGPFDLLLWIKDTTAARQLPKGAGGEAAPESRGPGPSFFVKERYPIGSIKGRTTYG